MKYSILKVIIFGEEEKNLSVGDLAFRIILPHLGGIHLIDLIIWILNDKPKSVMSFGNKIVTKGSKFKKKVLLLIYLNFKGYCSKQLLIYCKLSYFHELKIFEKNQTIIHNLKDKFLMNKKKQKKKLSGDYPDKSNRKKLNKNFIDHIKDSSIKPILTLKDQVDLMSICFYADKSLSSKKEMVIKYL